ncbi:Lanosterol 14-alpha-demethylase [Marasmius crinis-equi]|uniref:Lanosterol 14-alpha-demethylase n=1 Tax=Marasmius crinis-equi TaxID=585013 RepID=A0ABR3FDS7_9AGAR
MSNIVANLTGSIPLVKDAWSGYLAQAQEIQTYKLLLIGGAMIPILSVVLNVLYQLIIPRRKTDPPLVFHWFPIIGSAISYGTDPVGFFFRCREKYGNVFTFVLIGRRVTVALGPQGNNFVLAGKGTTFSAEDAYTHLTTPVFGKDVVYDVPNDKFMEQKKFVKVGLSSENMKLYVGMIEDEVEEFLKNDNAFAAYQKGTDEWGSEDAVKILSEITILTASRTLQGREVRGNLDKNFAQLYSDLDGGFTPINFLFPNLPLENYRKRDVAQAKMSQFYQNFIRQRRQGNLEHDHDMMAALMAQKYRTGEPLKDHEIAHMMIALLMAGQHTSSATGSWALLHLAANPDVAEALYQEQVKYFAAPDGSLRSLSLEELRQLPLLDSVIRETLRMHPPIHSIMRYVRDDVAVPTTLSTPSENTTYVVPKGYYVLASPLVSQMDPTIWREPGKWDPYRWSDPEGVAAQAYKDYTNEAGEKIDYGFGAVSKATDSPYQPFGAGRHRCIGEQFAYLQLGVVVSTFIRRLELRLHGEVPTTDFTTMISMPKEPRHIQFRRRKVD